jgi:hypothetical protein
MNGRFTLGYVVATPGALEALEAVSSSGIDYLLRHHSGDWGELCRADAALNNTAIADGSRILSAYTLPNGVKIWIITDAGHEVTTFLLPEEY